MVLLYLDLHVKRLIIGQLAQPGSEWTAGSSGRLETAARTVCFTEMSEEFSSNPLPPAGCLLLESHQRMCDTVDKDSLQLIHIKKKKDHFELLSVRVLLLSVPFLFKVGSGGAKYVCD